MQNIQPKIYEPTPPRKVAFIGLGVMGYPMAGHLALAGHDVTVYNRTLSKAQSWLTQYSQSALQRIRLAETPYLAAQDAAMVFCCVGNDDDVRSVTLGEQGAFAAMQQHSIFIDHSTTSAHLARSLHAQAQTLGLHFIDAPVSGGQAGAQNGQLTVMCGGDEAPFGALQTVVSAYAKACTLLGASGSGQLAKMVNQIAVAGLLQGLSEAIAFGQHSGLDMLQVLEVISKGAAQSWQMDNRGATMVQGEFNFGFAVDWMRKDLGLVLQEAQRNGARLPTTALIDQFYADVQKMGGKRWDTSSLIQRLR
jgi:3-hydroxyisobutyrate dehydrogenase